MKEIFVEEKLMREKLYQIAKLSDEIAVSKGFDPHTWQNVTTKLAFVITELDEAHDAVIGTGEDPLEEELADAAIRILSLIHGVWGDDWTVRWSSSRTRINPYQSIEALLWPTVKDVCKAIESRRYERKEDTKIYMEYALADLLQLSRSLGIDLVAAIEAKCEKNKGRPRLNGKVSSEG